LRESSGWIELQYFHSRKEAAKKEGELFHDRFQRSDFFACKTAQFGETPRESVSVHTAPKSTLRDSAKTLF
jgi:hypothetical protein